VDEVTAAVGLPVLGVVPHMSKRQSPGTRGRKVHLEPMSDVAEAYRAVRSAVMLSGRARTILVTSAVRAEGKSTTASNLSIALAEAGHRVLLMDADLREPTQHRIFAVGDSAGLGGVVAGRTPLERAIVSTSIKGLELLPCGAIPFNPSETINNQAFADLLSHLASRYEYVVLDSPPVMPVTDARILGAMCDVTLLVLRAEQTARRAASDARDGLMGFGANILGVIVNDGARRQQRYGYYGGYGGRNGTPAPQAPETASGPQNGEPYTHAGTDLVLSSLRDRA
jgi:capsular exopolysaccharide synthesis family protein